MTNGELAQRLRNHQNLILAGSSHYDREIWSQLVAALERDAEADLKRLIGKLATPPRTPPTRKKGTQDPRSNSEPLKKTVETMRHLYVEVRKWRQPDFDLVKKRTETACRGLTKKALTEASQELLGRKNSDLKVADLRAELANPAIETLRTRFMNIGA